MDQEFWEASRAGRQARKVEKIGGGKKNGATLNQTFGGHLIFGLVRGTFVTVIPVFVLVSRIQFTERYRGNVTSFSVSSSSRLETMVNDTLTRVSTFRVGLGVGRTTIVSGSCLRLFIMNR